MESSPEKQEGVPKAHKCMRSSVRYGESQVEVELLPGREFVSGANVQDLPRATTLWEIPRIFHENVPGFSQLAVDKERRLPGEVMLSGLRGPIERHLAPHRPVLTQLAGPWQLQPWVITMT